MIRELSNGKYRLVSHTGKNLGTFDSKEAAMKHEHEVQFFKHHGSKEAAKDKMK
jgi:hypothetical protein